MFAAEPLCVRPKYDSMVGAPTPVGLFPDGETPESVADMAGNVWEWTQGDFDAETKALRGGVCYDYARVVRVSYRDRVRPVYRFNGIGFRCVGE